ncbi:MAG: ANTAR domain-containing protein [Gammaproteobacteria bacterium]|nr:ANTAR domain-containing protein [Gammaproteobacteria bacterium]
MTDSASASESKLDVAAAASGPTRVGVQRESPPLRLVMPTGLAVLLIDEDSSRLDTTRRLLEEQGFYVQAQDQCLREIVHSARGQGKGALRPDAVVVRRKRVDELLLQVLAELDPGERTPIVLLSEDATASSIEAAIQAGVDAYVVVGVSGGRLSTAIATARAHFARMSVAHAELIDTRRRLEERKIIERAKGVVMRQRGIDEAQAYRLLRERAMRQEQRLAEIARAVTDAADLLEDL